MIRRKVVAPPPLDPASREWLAEVVEVDDPNWAPPMDNPPGIMLSGPPKIKIRRFDLLRCKWCGGVHWKACRRVKRLDVWPDGHSSVRYWGDSEWDDSDVIWQEAVYGVEDAEESG